MYIMHFMHNIMHKYTFVAKIYPHMYNGYMWRERCWYKLYNDSRVAYQYMVKDSLERLLNIENELLALLLEKLQKEG